MWQNNDGSLLQELSIVLFSIVYLKWCYYIVQ